MAFAAFLGLQSWRESPEIATQNWSSRQQNPSGCTVRCCAWHWEGMREKELQMQMLPSVSLHSSSEDRFFFVFESLRAEFSYLGPKEHKSSKILSSVNKKENCVYK